MFESAADAAPGHASVAPPQDIHLLDLLILLARQKTLVLGMPLLGAALALGASFLITPTFSSTTKLLPPQQQNSGMSAVLGQLGSLAGAAGLTNGIKNSGDTFIGMLESRTVGDSLITRFKLKERYDKKTMDDTRKELAESTAIVNSKKDGLIVVTTVDRDPQFAADLANAYFEELSKLAQTLAITEAAQRRAFFEKQLQQVKGQLADAEVGLRATQEKTGLIQPQAQVEAIITSIAKLKGTVVAKEVELNAMRMFATARNPELMRVQEELRTLRAQLAKLEQIQAGSGRQQGDFMVPTGSIPEAGVAYVRALREVKYYETIFELLAKQFEMAKIDEAKEPTQVQQLDKAVAAERRLKPKRALLTLSGLIGGAILGLMLAFARTAYLNSRSNGASNARWEQLAQAWRHGRKA